MNIYNTSRDLGVVSTGICPWESHDILRQTTWASCEETVFWNITSGEDDYPLVGPSDWGTARDITVSRSILHFHSEADKQLEDILTYKYPS